MSSLEPSTAPDLTHSTRNSKQAQQTRLLLAVTAAMWFLAVIVGIILHRDLTSEQLAGIKRNLPMLWFDRLLRRYGALLPFVGFIIRWWGSAMANPGPSVTPAKQFAEAGVIYVSLSLARFFVYLLHVTGVLHLLWGAGGGGSAESEKRSHLVSDHLVLGASLTAILTTELGLGVADLRRAMSRPRPEVARISCVLAALGVTAFLTVGTALDMFYTARYFHGPSEILGALVLGYLLFQGPLALWLLSGEYEAQPSPIKPRPSPATISRHRRTED